MKKIKKYMLSVIVLTASSMSNATTIVNTKITMLKTDKKYSHHVYIKTSVPHEAGAPECHSSPWSYVLEMDSELSKSMHSLLLSAYMSGKPISLTGNDTCTAHSTIEDLRRIEFASI
ncbi:hypothetical protein HQQ94_01980 [Shewanella sp. VB17]|uniref:hypothetical protein n=1 Tax=Shewanella sp. VB17 TaxID=2739432 RepID=UPI001564B438|nr:hypothetical protein [Shewanella sp. VB17]NRD72030.1 hypothetical protein [Shewanella sp. VB17]